MVNSTADRVKLIVRVIEIAEKVTKYLPIIVFSYAGLTIVFAVIYLLEHNVVANDSLHTRRVWHISCNKDLFSESKMET